MSLRPRSKGKPLPSQANVCNRLQKPTAIDKLHDIQEILRHIDPPLEPFKRSIMFEMWGTSTSWGKRWGFLSLNDLARRCAMSKAKVATTVAELVMLGLLAKRRTPDKTGYMINYEVIEAMAMGKKGADMLARKRTRLAEGSPSVLVHDVDSPSLLSGREYLPVIKGTANKEANRPAAGLAPEEEDPQADTTQAMEDYARRHWTKTGAKSLFVTWRSAWERSPHYRFAGVGCPPWSRKEQGQAGHLMKAWPGTTWEFHEFLDWAVDDWQSIMRDWGGTRKPRLPTIAYLLAAKSTFFGKWAALKVDGFAGDGTNDRVERLMVEGVSEYDAVVADHRIRNPEQPAAEKVGPGSITTKELKPRKKRRLHG